MGKCRPYSSIRARAFLGAATGHLAGEVEEEEENGEKEKQDTKNHEIKRCDSCTRPFSYLYKPPTSCIYIPADSTKSGLVSARGLTPWRLVISSG